MSHQPSCKDRINQEWHERRLDFIKLLEGEKTGKYDEELGPLNEYGLCIENVDDTKKPTREGAPFRRNKYLRFLLSWGGPSDEIRVYLDGNKHPVKIEYWFMDWFDGAKKTITSDSIAKQIAAYMVNNVGLGLS